MPATCTDRTSAPALTAEQEAVLTRRDPVVQVVGGPGTGKTTLAVELVARRVQEDGLAPQACVLLAPTRTGAARLRSAATARIGRTTTEPLARTAAALAFAVLRQGAVLAGRPAPRLLSGAEQDLVLADLLAGHRLEEGSGPPWPDSVRAALGTRGFRDQLRDLLMRAVEHGLEPETLVELGHRHERPEWVAAAEVLREYDEVTALRSPGAFDPAWICTAAADLVEDDPEVAARVHAAVRLVVVDDAHELTASAARLVGALTGPQGQLVLFGDGDLTVQGFRGAAPERFAQLARDLAGSGEPVTLTLRTGHRMGAALSTAAARVAERIGVSTGTAHRDLAPAGPEGDCRTVTLRTVAQETAYVADLLRRAHLIEGVPWSELAVIARSRGRHESLRRGLAGAGIPVVLPGGGEALAQQPAVRMLLTAYAVALRVPAEDRPSATPEEAVDLVTSALGGADPVQLRRLRRELRRAELEAGGSRGPDEVLAELLDHPGGDRVLGEAARPAGRVAAVLAAGREVLRQAQQEGSPASAEDLLWALWQAGGLAAPWAEAATGSGPAADRADRDLDAVMVLFGAAADFVQRLPGMAPEAFVAHVSAQEVAADTLVDRARPGQAVAVLTPQTAAGRQWRRVVVVGVQEGVWPDLRLRDTLLGAQALVDVLAGRPADGPAGVRSAQAQVRADELRQFYSAVTRAREQLVVTAVAGVDEQPSALLDVLDPQDGDRHPIEVPAELTLRGVVAELRRTLVRAHRAGDRTARERAAAYLVRLAAENVPGADPGRWWSEHDVSDGRPLQAEGPVAVSPSRVQTFAECPLRWLLTGRGGQAGDGPSAAAVGTLVHDVIGAEPDGDLERLEQALERRWPELGLGQGWVAERARTQAGEMLRRYVRYVADAAARGYSLAAVEQDLAVTVGQARITGRVDRLESDPDGRLRVVDLKTGSSKPRATDIAEHAQLGIYQVAVAEGALGEGGSAGAALVHLGKAGRVADAAVQHQPALADAPDPRWAHHLLERTAEGMAAAVFPACEGSWCRTCPVAHSCPAKPEGQVLR